MLRETSVEYLDLMLGLNMFLGDIPMWTGKVYAQSKDIGN